MRHYQALDGARGLAALLVCLFHFHAAGPIAASPLVRGGWLCVDFFFVLSGFVIAAGWRGRLNRPGDLPVFLGLRLARVWPLHMVMLLLFLAFELVGLVLAGAGIMQRPVFGPGHQPEQWLAAALLLNCFAFVGGPVWNVPAWSIAAEYWSWLIFGIAWVAGGRHRLRLVAGLAALAWGLMLVDGADLNRTWDGGLWRAVCGFLAGVLVLHLPRWQPPSVRRANLAELAAVGLALALIIWAPAAPWNLAAPILFALVVHTLASDAGVISRLLARPLFQWLGLVSSAVYLVHSFVQARLGDALDLLPRLVPGLPPVMQHGPAGEVFGRTPQQGLIATALMLVLVLIAAHLARLWVEDPVREAARRRWHPARKAV